VRQADHGFRAAAARNLGAAAAEGELLCFLDADTVPEPRYVQALSALPALLPDAVVVGRRRHADFVGWTPERIGSWFAGGAGPPLLPEPAWLREAYAQSDNLLSADDRSYRYLISAVLGLSRDLFNEVGGFDESFTRYGGEDWELGHRLFTAGAVLAHRPDAVAWHDGPDWALRSADPAAARAQKNAETRDLARLLPDPEARGPGTWHYPDVVVVISGGDDDARLLGARSVLDGALDVQVWMPSADLAGLDLRLHAGSPPADVLARCRTQIRFSRPVSLAPGALADLIAQVRPGRQGRVTARIGEAEVEVLATRALRRAQRWSGAFDADLVETLFGSARVELAAHPVNRPDLGRDLPRR